MRRSYVLQILFYLEMVVSTLNCRFGEGIELPTQYKAERKKNHIFAEYIQELYTISCSGADNAETHIIEILHES